MVRFTPPPPLKKAPMTVRRAIMAYLRRFDGATYEQCARRFHAIFRHVPDFQKQLMRNVLPESVIEQVLAHIKSVSLRVRYTALLQDFFRFSTRRGWLDKKS